ncbi:hypothetical protein LCGC14_2755330, partial [marine sediment metagenome]
YGEGMVFVQGVQRNSYASGGLDIRRYASWGDRGGYIEATYHCLGNRAYHVRAPYPRSMETQWSHVAVTWSVKDRLLELFVDGKSAGKAKPGDTPWYAVPWDNAADWGHPLVVSTMDHGHWSGTMRDEFYIYNRPLTAEEIKAAGRDSLFVKCDVTDKDQVQGMVRQVVERFGRLDIGVNNAGIGILGGVEDFDDDEVRSVFETNVFGVIRVTRAVLPHMRSEGSGTIVNVGSIAGKVTAPFGGIYSASKHAVEALSDALYFEAHPFGIRVVLIEPGGFETEIQNNVRPARRFTEGSAYVETERQFSEASVKLPGGGQLADAQIVADAIVEAAKSEEPARRYLVGEDAKLIAGLAKRMSDEEFEKAMRTTLDIWD